MDWYNLWMDEFYGWIHFMDGSILWMDKFYGWIIFIDGSFYGLINLLDRTIMDG